MGFLQHMVLPDARGTAFRVENSSDFQIIYSSDSDGRYDSLVCYDAHITRGAIAKPFNKKDQSNKILMSFIIVYFARMMCRITHLNLSLLLTL